MAVYNLISIEEQQVADAWNYRHGRPPTLRRLRLYDNPFQCKNNLLRILDPVLPTTRYFDKSISLSSQRTQSPDACPIHDVETHGGFRTNLLQEPRA
jgi:hypothetical protein